MDVVDDAEQNSVVDLYFNSRLIIIIFVIYERRLHFITRLIALCNIEIVI